MSNIRSAFIASTALALAATNAFSVRVRLDPSTVLVVVNDSTPLEPGTGNKGASQYVADHYASARKIPPGNIVHIRVPMGCCENDPKAWDSWTISWQSFKDNVRTPIKQFMALKRLTSKIKYIVPTYGVPSHISRHPYGATGLSVDAMLSIMSTRYADLYALQNPLYNPDPDRMPHVTQKVFRSPFYFVSRLDGPSAQIAAGLVDKALDAERGISRKSGVGYFDWQNRAPGDGYYVADQTMLSAYNLCVEAGMQCNLNDQSIAGGLIMNAPNTLWAWGWYSGGQVNDVYTFVPGAVGAQLTSYTAGSIRTPAPGAWVPLWLERGVTATWGATSEPYVDRYTVGDCLLNRLWKGYTFAEAAYLATPYLGWTMVFVGDPLYSPRFID